MTARGHDLRLERVLDAHRERVFDACVRPEELAEWWGPAGFTAPRVELDVRPGGRFRIRMQPPGGDAFHLRGEYRDVARPERLAFTFEWEEPDADDRETLVTLSFAVAGRGARVVVEHVGFATEARRALHEAGWTDSLERLARFLAATDTPPLQSV